MAVESHHGRREPRRAPGMTTDISEWRYFQKNFFRFHKKNSDFPYKIFWWLLFSHLHENFRNCYFFSKCLLFSLHGPLPNSLLTLFRHFYSDQGRREPSFMATMAVESHHGRREPRRAPGLTTEISEWPSFQKNSISLPCPGPCHTTVPRGNIPLTSL